MQDGRLHAFGRTLSAGAFPIGINVAHLTATRSDNVAPTLTWSLTGAIAGYNCSDHISSPQGYLTAGCVGNNRTLVVTATTTQGFEAGWYFGAGRVRVSTEIVDITTAEPFVELASEPESVRRGERKRFTWTVRQKSPFEGNASVKLVGLPKGVSVVEPLPVITKDSKDLVFEIEASDEALMGAVKGLVCEVIVQAAGQEIHQRSGSGTLRIDPKL